MKIILIAMATIVAASSAVQARPIYVEADAPRTAHVRTADVNLNSAAGRRLIDRRIEAAAAQVCSADSDRSVMAELAAHACYTAAVNDGNRQLARIVNASGTSFAARALSVSGL